MKPTASLETIRTKSRTAGLGCLIAVALAAAAIGCGSDEADSSGAENGDGGVIDVSGVEPLGEETAGSVAQLAQCRDWNRGTREEKLATIDDIRSQVNMESPGVEAPPLSDEEAMEVFDGACQPAHAQGFRLYVIYARAAGYAPLAREP